MQSTKRHKIVQKHPPITDHFMESPFGWQAMKDLEKRGVADPRKNAGIG